MPIKPQHRNNVGSVIRGLLNGVKHMPQTIGPVIGVEPEILEEIIAGKIGLTENVEKALLSVPGINQRDFYFVSLRVSVCRIRGVTQEQILQFLILYHLHSATNFFLPTTPLFLLGKM